MDLTCMVTPEALVDAERMEANILRMQQRMNMLGVSFRPHVKTAKCVAVAEAQRAAGAKGITVSTLKEAEQFFAAGFPDIIYAVGITPCKLPRVLALMRKGADLKVLVDSVESARNLAEAGTASGAVFSALIEIDVDGHRSGALPDAADLEDIARALESGGARLEGVLSHAGSSYELSDSDALAALAERERSGTVRAAERLRGAGFVCPVVSVGSTPTALSARSLEGVTEVRAGVYAFFDLVMYNVGVCSMEDIALSVLATVIGHQRDKGWAIVDAGWMALSRDRGTAGQTRDFGYGQVCGLDGRPMPGYIVSGTNQEHGIISLASSLDKDIAGRFPLGSMLRILPNHACATAAQFPEYHVFDDSGRLEQWPRFYGW